MISDVTVIVPAYNVQNTIEKCLNSLLAQKKCFPQIIVIDDGSTDSTLTILKKIATKHSQIKVISQKNHGVSYARNKGLLNCNTEYVTFVDADDYVDADYLYNLWIGFSKNSQIDLAVSGVECIDFNGKKHAITNLTEKIVDSSHMQADLFKIDGPSGYLSNKLWKMKIITEKNLRMDTSLTMAEDLLFTVEYLQFTRKVAYLSSIDYYYIRSKKGLSSGIEVSQNNANFRKTNEDFIKALHKVITQIPSSLVDVRKNACTQYAIANANFLRQLRKNVRSKVTYEDKKLIKKSKSEAIKFQKCVLKNKTITIKKKCVFLLSLWNPIVMSWIDRIYMYYYRHIGES